MKKRFLGIGEWNDLGSLYLRLIEEGHEVRVFVEESSAHGILEGLVPRVEDWRSQLDWIREAGKEGFLLFESASKGELQDQLRAQGFQVIGSCAFGDRLENDRPFGQSVLREIGLPTAAIHAFQDFPAAIDFVARHPAPYVFKLNGPKIDSTLNYVGEMENGADVRALLEHHRDCWPAQRPVDFVLMERIEGIEMGVGAYFNGEKFLQPALLDWEHKRFLPGDLGELTGEMGTVVTYRHAETFFEKTLARLRPQLAASGYCGYINLNTLVNKSGIWPLEFTCRFGYPGFAICGALHREGWGSIFEKLASGSSLRLETAAGFAVGVVLTVPPFPYETALSPLSKRMPISYREPLDESDRHHLHWGEVARLSPESSDLVSGGGSGYVAVVTGCDEDLAEAQRQAYRRIKKLVVANGRYRIDIGDKLRDRDFETLRAWGYLT